MTAGGRSQFCGTKSRSTPVGSPGRFRRAAGSPAARGRTSLSSRRETTSLRCATEYVLIAYQCVVLFIILRRLGQQERGRQR